MLSIGNLIAIQLTTPLLLRKPCKLFASVLRVCQRQLSFLVMNSAGILLIPVALPFDSLSIAEITSYSAIVVY